MINFVRWIALHGKILLRVMIKKQKSAKNLSLSADFCFIDEKLVKKLG